MFNPQRKAKVADICMQEKAYSLHLKKVDQIERSLSLKKKRYAEENQQQTYVSTLSKSKEEVKKRLSANLKKENKKLMKKLQETDNRKELFFESKEKKKHFNSYFSNRKELNRVHADNYAMVMRMNQQSSDIPSFKELKKQYKANKKLARNCRKLPSILKNQEDFKFKFSNPIIQQSRTLQMRLGK